MPVYSDFLYVSKGRTHYFVNVVAPGATKTQLPSLENGIAKLLAAQGQGLSGGLYRRGAAASATLDRQAPPGAGFVE